MITKRRIAFIRWGSFSHINDCVQEILERHFVDAQIDVIDINELIPKSNPLSYLHALRSYGHDVARRRKTLSEARERTPFVFQTVRRRLLERLNRHPYDFTFQTQSMFDGSKPGTPHFVYTDCTYLANLHFPDFSHRDLPIEAWMQCERSIYEHATNVFAMSHNIADSLISHYACPADKVALVYCGANAQTSKDERFGTERYAKKRILFVGIDWRRKGGPALVEAYKKVLKAHPDASLTVVGCSPRINLPNCNVVGMIPLPEVKKYFENATLFCLPTLLEPFGVVFLEAMAHGLPIVATRLGAIPDFVIEGQNGHLVEPNNSEQIADRISALLSEPAQMERYGDFGHSLYWRRYTWEQTGVRICDHIEAALGYQGDATASRPHEVAGCKA